MKPRFPQGDSTRCHLYSIWLLGAPKILSTVKNSQLAITITTIF